MSNKENATASLQFDTFSDLEQHIASLHARQQFDLAIQTGLQHAGKFLTLAHSLIAESYFRKSVSNPHQPNGSDFKQCLLHATIAGKYRDNSYDLMFDNPKALDGRSVKDFVQAFARFVNSLTIKEQTYQWLEQNAEQWYQSHPATATSSANYG